MTVFFGHTGRVFLAGLHTYLTVCRMIADTLEWTLVRPFRGGSIRVEATIRQFVEYGYNGMPIVMLISFLIGAILALQSAYQLASFGAAHLTADLVGVAAMRELAPLMTAILMTGRSGSAITAEIGTMKVSEELDALEVMGLNRTKYLIVPKVLAMLFAVPMVTLISIITMAFGGFVISVLYLRMDPEQYIIRSANSFATVDLATGLVKSVFFGLVISWVGVYRGFQARGGAEGVGKQTTSSVVTSIFFIIVVDMVFTWMFFSL